MISVRTIYATIFTFAVFLNPAVVTAGIIDITATSAHTSFTDFSLQFDDTSNDGLLQIDEVTYFSGFTITDFFGTDGFYDLIVGTPDIIGISTLSGVVIGDVGKNWNFKRSSEGFSACCSAAFWTYSSAESTVPEPSVLALFAAGLFGLGLKRRRRLS